MNYICLERSFTLTSSNNNLWVWKSISEILKTKSIGKFSKVLLLIHVSHDYYHISNHCPLFRLTNTLKFSGSQYYVETKILSSPHSVHFRQKALKVILLYYLQIPDGAFIFSVAVKNISAHSVRNYVLFFCCEFQLLGKQHLTKTQAIQNYTNLCFETLHPLERLRILKMF